MAGRGTRVAAAAATGLAVLGLAGCDAGDGPGYVWGQYSESIELSIDPAVLLLQPDEFPLAGWALQPPSDDDPTVDDETGGICALDWTDVLTPEQQASIRGVAFSNAAQMTLITEYVWDVGAADDVLATIAAQLAACAGPYAGTSGDSAVTVESAPSGLTMPGATSSVCRTFAVQLEANGPVPGTMCLGASGSLMLSTMMFTYDPAVATPEADFVTVMTAATAKAFAT